ncbi:MAG: hypothetical protein SOW41_00595 [Anaerococcus sp.]|jgi:hypothetical protein|nr:hypothetical protein [Peptoniphilaceae bacterium]MDY3054539.1 hypothetical protein [Anaerococcus sp.]
MKDDNRAKYTEVWGDRVVLKELAYACLLGVVLTMAFFLIGQKIFHSMNDLEESLADGYALVVGVAGCILSGAISAKLFKPKRVIEEKVEFEEIEEIIRSAGLTIEEEAKELANADEDIIKELEDLKLYALLALIPEGSKNYKAEYKIKAGVKE